MIATIDTPAAREMYGQRLAIVEPVFGNSRTQKRLDRLTWRGKIKVNMQWRLYCMLQNIEKIVHYGLAASSESEARQRLQRGQKREGYSRIFRFETCTAPSAQQRQTARAQRRKRSQEAEAPLLTTLFRQSQRRHAGDGVQRPLLRRSRCSPRLMPGVRVCRDKPAQCAGVQVSDSAGVAHHAGPEACARLGHEDREAWTGARAGRLERPASGRGRGADALRTRGRPQRARRSGKASAAPGGVAAPWQARPQWGRDAGGPGSALV
jgi:hypothetical protein